MKSLARRPYTKRELEVMKNEIDTQVEKSVCKAQWLMILAFNEALGIGEQRILKVMGKYSELLEEYEGYKTDDVADELLSKRLKEILPNTFTKMYG